MFMVEIKHLRDDQAPLNIEIIHDAPGQWLLNEVVDKLGGILEKDYFGLRYLDKRKQRQWLDLSKSTQKQLKNVKPKSLSFRVKHYPKNPLEEFKTEKTRYLLYLQLRRDLHSGRLVGRNTDMQILAAQILQAEIGDYTELMDYLGENGTLTDLQMFANMTPRVEAKIMDIHKSLVGLNPSEVECMFLQKATEFDTYGVEPIFVEDRKGNGFYAGLNHEGVVTFRDNRKVHVFIWNKISKISADKRLFIIQVEWEQRRHVLGFKCQTPEAAEALWKWAVDRQGFFTLNRSVEAKESKSSGGFFRRNKFYQFTGRCQKELMQLHSSMPNIPQASVKRSRSLLNIAIKVNNTKRYQSQDALNKRINNRSQFGSEKNLDSLPKELVRHQSMGSKINTNQQPVTQLIKSQHDPAISCLEIDKQASKESLAQPNTSRSIEITHEVTIKSSDEKEDSPSKKRTPEPIEMEKIATRATPESYTETLSDMSNTRDQYSNNQPKVLNQVGVLGASGFLQHENYEEPQLSSGFNSPNDVNQSVIKSSQSQMNLLDPTINPNSTTTLASVSPQNSYTSPLNSPSKSVSKCNQSREYLAKTPVSNKSIGSSPDITYNTPLQTTIYQYHKEPSSSNDKSNVKSEKVEKEDDVVPVVRPKEAERNYINQYISSSDNLRNYQSNEIFVRDSSQESKQRVQISPYTEYDSYETAVQRNLSTIKKPPAHPDRNQLSKNTSLRVEPLNVPANQPLLINYGYSASSKYSPLPRATPTYEQRFDGRWCTRIESLKQFPSLPRSSNLDATDSDTSYPKLYNLKHEREKRDSNNSLDNQNLLIQKENIYKPLSVEVDTKMKAGANEKFSIQPSHKSTKSIDLNNLKDENFANELCRKEDRLGGPLYESHHSEYKIHPPYKIPDSPNLVGISVQISGRPSNEFLRVSRFDSSIRNDPCHCRSRSNYSQSPAGSHMGKAIPQSPVGSIGSEPRLRSNSSLQPRISTFRPIPSQRIRNRVQYFDNV